MGGGTVGGGGVKEEAVGLRGAGDGREPAVEDCEFSDEGGVDWEVLRAEAFHDGCGEVLGDGEGLVDEAGHGGDGGGAEDLVRDSFEGVAGVRVHVLGVVGEADFCGGV